MLSRREFLKICANLSAAVCGSNMLVNNIAHGMMKLTDHEKPEVVFLQGQACSGCTMSMMYGNESSFVDFITRIIKLQVHPSLSFSDGEDYFERLNRAVDKGGYILVVEGSVPMKMKKACMIAGLPLGDILEEVIRRSKAVVMSGTCSANGGIPASGRNEVGAVSVEKYMEMKRLIKPYIKIAGCPSHPDRLMGTVAYMASMNKIPKKTEEKTPALYYEELIHNRCSRFQYFSQDIYLKDFEKEKHTCLLKKGCRGTITKSDCPTRRWNGSVNVCIESNTPCVGCINPSWPFKKDIYLDADSVEDIPWAVLKEKVRAD